jgi:hypothetical protein
MSFNTNFDFVDLRNKVNTNLEQLNAELSRVSALINDLNNITDYPDCNNFIQSQLFNLNSTQTRLDMSIAKHGPLLVQISLAEEMSDTEKNKLYNIWTMSSNLIYRFMARLVPNYNTILTHPVLNQLLNDQTLNANQKKLLCDYVLESFNMDPLVYDLLRQ